MRCKFFSAVVSALFAFSLLFSCAGSPDPVSAPVPEIEVEYHEQDFEGFIDNSTDPLSGLEFVPDGFPSFGTVPGLGVVTREERDMGASLNENERNLLSESFRTAYYDNLLRGVPLAGVLGGDLVHGWPSEAPSGWVQNWRTSAPASNSWGIPPLVLAIKGIGAERVFTVQGQILDHYGKSAGINGANGDVGYGSPLGYEFFYEGKIAQRFDLGLITIDRDGVGAFLPEEPPSLKAESAAGIGVFSRAPYMSGNSPLINTVKGAFLSACRMALDRGVSDMIPDSPGFYLALAESLVDFTGVEALRGFYIQSFNGGSILLVLADSPVLPPCPRMIASPFLDAFLAPSEKIDEILPPAENPVRTKIESGDYDGLSRLLLSGFALYGIPLTDPMPIWKDSSSWQEAQRFSRGWLLGAIHEFGS